MAPKAADLPIIGMEGFEILEQKLLEQRKLRQHAAPKEPMKDKEAVKRFGGVQILVFRVQPKKNVPLSNTSAKKSK
ncbi:hypothetical protein U1Q18_020032 [Sarracenia purpurea var. burkii]